MAKILIVEDEAHIARILALWLRQHGYEILEARDGRAALEILSREAVDLIVSDMNMPELDGLGLVRAVRTDLKLTVPIFLLSARCDRAKLATDLEPYQVQLYAKPFMPSRLVADIEQSLSVGSS